MKKKISIIMIACVVIVISGVGFVSFSKISRAEEEETTKTIEGYVQSGSMEAEAINVSGTTEAGTNYEYFPVSITCPLEVEKIYVESGAEVTTQSAICKVTEESYLAMRKQLKKNVETAKKELSQATIDYKLDLLSLQSEYTSQAAVTDTAYDSYTITIENLASNVELAKGEWEDAVSVINTYPAKIDTSVSRRKYAKSLLKKYKTTLEQLQEAYDTATDKYNTAKQEYEKAESSLEEINIVQAYIDKYSGGEGEKNITAKDNASSNEKVADESEKVIEDNPNDEVTSVEISQDTFEKFKEQVKNDAEIMKQQHTDALEQYQSAKTDMETKEEKLEKKQDQITTVENRIQTLSDNIKTYKTELAEAEDSLDALKAAYDKACADEMTGTVEAEKGLQQNLLVEGSASISYRMSVANLTKTLEQAEDAYKDALETWSTFEDTFEDGIWYAQEAGSISYLGYEEGGFLTNTTPILGYYDSDIMSVEVTVDQSDISGISVGDEVSVSTTSMRGGLTGVVSKIDNEQNSSSVSKVTYAVTISVDNENDSLTSGDTATISFAAGTLDNVIYLSARLVQNDSRGDYVTVINEDGEKEDVMVTLGVNNGTFIQIKDGLTEGEHCVVVTKEGGQEEMK